MAKNKSIEEQVEFWCKQQLQDIKLYFKTESINPEIEEALRKAPSKNGGEGMNFPDIKCFITTSDMRHIPVMIEVKGLKGNLIKCDIDGSIQNKKSDGTPHYSNISKYAVNGAVHYANAVLNYSESYKEVIAIGVNGYKLSAKEVYEIGVYYISKENLFVPKEVGKFTDLSFLRPPYLDKFIESINNISLSDEEIDNKKLELEDDIERKLKDINQKMHDELKIVVGARVQLITGLVMAGLGVPGKVRPLYVSDLTGELGEESNDGKKVMNKISDYLVAKNLPIEKIQMIKSVLNVVFLHSKLQEPINGESRIHTLYADVKQNIMPFITGELHNIDFTGRLFNVLNEWVDVPDGDKNDVVITPRYVTEFMARLCRVNKDSYVWDFATGSAGFLISAMHQMISDAKDKIHSPEELKRKIAHIKMSQLMGIEKLPDIYLLAVLNMILMKDGCSNIIHGDSLNEFDGFYEQGVHKGEKFPANVFLLNPPYSAEGKGFVFVRKAFEMMNSGYAAVLIQENAGRGKGLPYTAEILKNNTLLASIRMSNIFCGKASVQTAVYVFQVGTPHDTNQVVKFIDFSKDGYARQNRKKSSQNVNLRDTDNAKERYDEVIKLVCYGRGAKDENLNYLKQSYVEDYITLNGDDWTYSQHCSTNISVDVKDMKDVLTDYYAWRIGEFIRGPKKIKKSNNLQKDTPFPEGGFREFRVGNLFDIHPTKSYGLTNYALFATKGETPVVTNSSINNGVSNRISLPPTEDGNIITYSDTTTSDAIFYQPEAFVGYSHIQGLYPYEDIWNERRLLYFVVAFRKAAANRFDYGNKFNRAIAKDMYVSLPCKKDGNIDFEFMEERIRELEEEHVRDLKFYIKKKINSLK